MSSRNGFAPRTSEIAAKDPHRVETLDGGKSKEDLCAEIRALVHLRLGVAID